MNRFVLGSQDEFFRWQAMKEDTPEKYAAHFSKSVAEGLEPDELEDLYKEVHEAIRADPKPQLTEKKKPDKPRT